MGLSYLFIEFCAAMKKPGLKIFYTLMTLLVTSCGSPPPHYALITDVPDSQFALIEQIESTGDCHYHLKSPMWIGDIPCSADMYPLEPDIRTDAEKHLLQANLLQPIIYQGVPCSSQLTLYPNGQLRTTILDRSIQLLGFDLKAGEGIYFHPNGKLAGGRLKNERIWGQVRMLPENDVKLDQDGHVVAVESGWEGTYYKENLYRNQTLTLDTAGNLLKAENNYTNPSH